MMPVAALFSCSSRAVTHPPSRTAMPAMPSTSVRHGPVDTAAFLLASVIGEVPPGGIARVGCHVRRLFGRRLLVRARVQALLRLLAAAGGDGIPARVAESGLTGEAQADHGGGIPHGEHRRA